MLRRVVVAVLAALILPLFAPVAAGAAFTVDGGLDAVSVEADASMRLATVPSVYRAPKGVLEYRVAADGTIGARRALVPARKTQAWASSAFTGDGAVAAYSVKGKRRSVIRAVVWGPAGLLGRAQTISDRRHGAGGTLVVAGVNGAAAVVFRQGRGRGAWQDMIAVRVAGAATFKRAVPLGRTRKPGFTSDLAEKISIVFDAQGRGAIAQAPAGIDSPADGAGPIRLRRIRPDGTVEPAIEVDRAIYGLASSDVSIAPDGTIVGAFRVLNPGMDGESLLASTLPVGATRATPLQKLGAPGDPSLGDDDLGLTLGPAGAPTLVSGDGRDTFVNIFEGPPNALTRTARLPAYEHANLTVTATDDGGASAFWTGAADARADRFAIMATHRPPGGAWAPPAPITAPVALTDEDDDTGFPGLGALAPLPGSGVLVLVQRASQDGKRRTIELVRAP